MDKQTNNHENISYLAEVIIRTTTKLTLGNQQQPLTPHKQLQTFMLQNFILKYG